MFRAFIRLTTGVELGLIAITAFVGAGYVALVSAGMQGNMRLLVSGFVVVATIGLVAYTITGIWRRYQRLTHGRCGHPVCHGTVAGKDGLPDHLVECSNCKRVWPRLVQARPEASVH